nr:nucleoside diphosphate hydrolase [Theileria orientalis]
MELQTPPKGTIKLLKRVYINKSPWIQLERIYYKELDSNDTNRPDVDGLFFELFTFLEPFVPVQCDDNGAPINLQKNVRYWDVFSRRQVNQPSHPNSATTLAFCYKLVDNKYSFFLSVVEQFRPSVNVHTLEFPSGICDPGEDTTTCGLRELKEETGYTGVLLRKSPNLPTSVLGNDNTCLITVLVDLDLDVNLNPVQSLEPTETITAHVFPLCNLLEVCCSLQLP